MKKLLLLLSVLVLFGCNKTVNTPILTIEGGQIQGVTTDIPGVLVYRGIPYAAAPIGDLRWKEPQPVVPWQGVRLCDRFGHPSYQAIQYPGGYYTEWGYGGEAPYSEDCLYANVWTKASGHPEKKLPVALWIHGGGYREGFGSEPEFDAQEWGARDVVLVSINYRLGVFGFLTHPELAAESPHGVSGNYGILDQIEALKWIKKNIAQFGGDPDNVMIFGQSAGAGSVKTLCESPLARGLFHKAVIMSGGGLTVPQAAPAAPAATAARPAGMPAAAGRSGSMMSMMRRASTPAEAAQQVKEIMDWAGFTDLKKMRAAATETIHALGTIYNGASGKFGYMTGSPMVDGYVSLESFDAAAADGTLADVPYMIGYTLNDMGDMSGGIAAFCLNREEKGNKAWAYEFARPLPDDGSHPEVTARLKGAFHSSDLWFVFKSLKHCWRPWTQGDWDLSTKMIDAWTNFAKNSDPGIGWEPYTKENPKFMRFKLDANDNEDSDMGDPIRP